MNKKLLSEANRWMNINENEEDGPKFQARAELTSIGWTPQKVIIRGDDEKDAINRAMDFNLAIDESHNRKRQ